MKPVLTRLVPVVLAAVGLWVLWRELKGQSLASIQEHVAHWGWPRLGLALALAAGGYLLLALNEQIALRWVGARVPMRKGVAVSFVSYAFANNMGLGWLVAGALRAGMYARYGVDLMQVAKITAYGSATFGLGLAALAGASLLGAPQEAYQALAVTPAVGRALGALGLAAPFAYVVACGLLPRKIMVFGHAFEPLSPALAGLQMAFGIADVSLTAGLMWVLLGEAAPHYAAFLSGYLLSVAAGLLSGVPGGVGVFEGAMVTMLPGVDRSALAAAFLGYRLFYYLLPLFLALLLLPFVRRGRTPKPSPPG